MTHPSEPIAAIDEPARSSFTIELATEVGAEIRQSALTAFRSLPYGGLEVGGILFGRVRPSVANPAKMEVIASRPIECDHAAGPAFVLSSAERLQVSQLFEPPQLDLSVVGFWVSHGRSDLVLTPHDLELYGALFPYSWQIVLILKPENNRPLREAFFFRNEGEVLLHKPPVVEPEREVETDLLPASPRLRSYWEPTPEPIAEPPAAPPKMEEEVEEQVTAQPTVVTRAVRVEKQSFGLWSGLTFLVFGLLLGGGLSYLLFGIHRPVAAKAPEPQLDLEMFNAGKDMLIHWDAKSSIVRNARTAELRIRDGRMVQTLVLDLAVLGRGHCHYQPSSGDVQTTLIVTAKDGQTERSTASQQIAF